MKKFSIIISAYNAEKYIDRLIKSLEEQTYKNFEIIFVDDGSKDNTLKIISSNVNERLDLKVYSIPHGGVSNARNFALKKVKGEWITFLDADDYFDVNCLEKINNIINLNKEIDLIQTNLLIDTNSSIYFQSEIEEKVIENPREIIKSIISENIANNMKFGNVRCIGGKFYKNELLIDSFFPIELESFEDGIFNLNVFNKAKKIYMCNEGVYYYVKNSDSVTNRINYNQLDQNNIILQYIEKFCKEHNYDEFPISLCCFEQLKIVLKNYFKIDKNLKINNFKKNMIFLEELYYKYFFVILQNKMHFLNKKDKIIFKLIYKKMYYSLFLIYKIKERR